MRIVVVYESRSGGTGTIARAVAQGLVTAGEVRTRSVDDVLPTEIRAADLLVAGGSASRLRRKGAREHRPTPARRCLHADAPGHFGRETLTAWLARMPPGPALAAAFDTRSVMPRWRTRAASERFAEGLRAKGYAVLETRSFVDPGQDGSLGGGERDRAYAWGRSLGTRLSRAVGG
jgi:hypothetical protein